MNLKKMRKFRLTSLRISIIRMSMVLIASFLVCASSFAQTKTITGVVTDATGEAVIGASVSVKGTSVGTATDIDGKYTITAPESGKILHVTYIGMKPKELTITGGVMNITLEEDAAMLDEVVVIGYGTVKKRDLTGTVSSVGEKSLKDVPVTTAAEAITGKLPGVQVTTTEGSPDAEIKIRIRGGGSITQDNSPLYIVDGFPVSSISDIPPGDISSIDVLKDASSTAIYGARGANGVIIVTTKTAKEGKFSVNYTGYAGFKNVTNRLDVLSPYEFALLQYEQAVLQNKLKTNYEPYFGMYEDIGLYKNMEGTNWQDVVFGRTGTTFNNNISVTGGNKVTSFNASYNRVDDKAIMLGSSYTRDNFNLKLNANPLDWMKLNFATRYSVTSVYGAGANDVGGSEKSTNDSRVRDAVIYTPIPLKNMTTPDDDPASIGSLYPPTVKVADNDRFRKTNSLNINGGISINLMKDLIWRTELGIDQIFREDNRYYGKSTYYVNGGGASDNLGHPATQLQSAKNNTFRNTNTLTYSFDYLKNHHFNAMVGEETLQTEYQTTTSVADNFPDFFDSEMTWSFTSKGRAVSVNNFYAPDNKLLSFFGRLNYDYMSRYLLTVTFRADGSSKFAPGNQWGYFPAVAAAWRINDEGFLKDVSYLSNLKLRVSYGEAGNNNILQSYMQSYASYSTSFIPFGSSYWAVMKDDNGQSLMANPNLKWETTVTRNAGLDFGFLSGRINGAIDVYSNSTKDLLINYPTTGSGYNYQLRNIGETSNKGVELSLNTVLIDKKDFHLEMNFNISANKNKIVNLGGLDQLDNISSGWTKAAYGTPDFLVEVGKPVGQMYGYVLDGMYSIDDFNWNGTKWVAKPGVVDNSALTGSSWGPGALKLKDLSGDGKITSDNLDRTVIGNANPKNTGGFGLSGSFKGFDASVNFNWVYGNSILNANKIEFSNTGGYYNRNMLADFSSGNRFMNIDANGLRVTDPAQLAAMNANATMWSPINDGTTSYPIHSGVIEDGSFLRLNNLTIGYTFPRAWMKKLYIQQFRIYATAYNLHTWTNYSGYDPEVDSRRSTPMTPGVDYSAYPKSQSFNFGVNLTF